ncbi:MAG: hypothetical protein NC915_04930 [Candidatus Omnitrophica bacterium]|nr:hypothetical protein [Candidatus Omnitrophota bacterium]
MKKKLEKIEEKLIKFLDQEDEIREKSLKVLREITRKISSAIKNIHKGQIKESKKDIDACIIKLKKLKKNLKKYPEIYYQGFLHQTEKEVVEAKATLTIIEKKDIPDLDDFDSLSYIHGLAESIGEIRRFILDKMRKEDSKDLDDYLEIMEEIYFFLLNFSYPDAITRSLRKQIDYVRGIVEKTRGEITTFYLFKKKAT